MISPDSLAAYPEMAGDIKEILLSSTDIQNRVSEIGQSISRDYWGQNPLLIGVLKGVLFFMADLLRAVTIPVAVDFIAISNYSPESRSQGIVHLAKDLETPLAGRHV